MKRARPFATFEGRIRAAGWFVVAGLLVELATLLWIHPMAFMAQVGVGIPLTAMGILLFAWAAVTTPSGAGDDATRERR
jgi:hypothetical protein